MRSDHLSKHVKRHANTNQRTKAKETTPKKQPQQPQQQQQQQQPQQPQQTAIQALLPASSQLLAQMIQQNSSVVLPEGILLSGGFILDPTTLKLTPTSLPVPISVGELPTSTEEPQQNEDTQPTIEQVPPCDIETKQVVMAATNEVTVDVPMETTPTFEEQHLQMVAEVKQENPVD